MVGVFDLLWSFGHMSPSLPVENAMTSINIEVHARQH